jgi:hypothetical protein
LGSTHLTLRTEGESFWKKIRSRIASCEAPLKREEDFFLKTEGKPEFTQAQTFV